MKGDQKYYNGLNNLRDVKTKVDYPSNYLDEMKRIREDIIYFAENYFFIVNADLGKMKIKLYEYQKEMLLNLVENRNNVFNCSRQIGKTTIVKVFILWYIITNVDKHVGVASYIEKSSMKILGEIKFSYTELPLWLQVSVLKWNEKSIFLKNGCQILTSATTENTFRGETINFLYVDETAIIPNNTWKEFEDSILPTLSSAKTSRIAYTSTPKGFNHFFAICEDARKGISTFNYLQIEWFKVPHYNEAWKQKVKNEISGFNKDDIFRQNYECAFISEDTEVIPVEFVKQIVTIKPLHNEGDILKFYKPYIEGHQYVIGVDTATEKGQDASAFIVLDITDDKTFEVVCVYNNDKIDPLEYSTMVEVIATKYHATAMIERNSYGKSVIDYLKSMFEFFDIEKIDGEFGLYTSVKTKKEMVDNLKAFIKLNRIIINDTDLLFQLSKFSKRQNGTYGALYPYHDDLVMALCFALYIVFLPAYEGKLNISTERIKTIKPEMEDEEVITLMIIDDESGTNRMGFSHYPSEYEDYFM